MGDQCSVCWTALTVFGLRYAAPGMFAAQREARPPPRNPHPTKAKTVEQTAADTKMTRETIYNIRDGETWPNFITIARLEIYFNIRLWGQRPPPQIPVTATGRRAPADRHGAHPAHADQRWHSGPPYRLG